MTGSRLGSASRVNFSAIRQRGEAFSYFLIVATFFNAGMFIVNLLPVRLIGGHPTDGLVLWALARHGRKFWSR